MGLIPFLLLIPPELSTDILLKAGARAAANLSLTCQSVRNLIQRDGTLWRTFFNNDLIDVASHPTYNEYMQLAKAYRIPNTPYAWYWHVSTSTCEVCHWYISYDLIHRDGIIMCSDCERNLFPSHKIYDV